MALWRRSSLPPAPCTSQWRGTSGGVDPIPGEPGVQWAASLPTIRANAATPRRSRAPSYKEQAESRIGWSSIAFGARPVTVCWRAAQASSRSRKRLRLDGPSGPGEEAGCSLTSCGTQADGRRSVGDYARRPEHAGRRHDPASRGRGVPGRRSRGRASRAGTEHLVYVATPLRLSAHELAQRLNDDSHDIGVRAVDLPSGEAQNGIASSFARKPLEMRPPDSHTGLARSGGHASCGPRGRQSDHKGVSHDRGGQHPEAGVRN